MCTGWAGLVMKGVGDHAGELPAPLGPRAAPSVHGMGGASDEEIW